MPLCLLCLTDFPALSVDAVCKRCTALQALGVDPEHPNYAQTKNWKQCMHCGISAPHLATSPNISKTTCLNDICVAWATSSTDGGESSAPPQNISSTSEQRNVAAQTRLKRFAPSAITINTALLKPRSTSGSSFLEKTVTVAYTVCRSNSKTPDPALGGQAVPKARSVLMPDLLAEFLETVNAEWVKSNVEKLIVSDVSFRFCGNRLLEIGTSSMSLGDFYDYYNHATRRELWLSRTIPLWKGVKGPTLHLDFNINMAAFKTRVDLSNSDEDERSVLGSKRKKGGFASPAKRIRSGSTNFTSHFSPAKGAGTLRDQLNIQKQVPIQLLKVECSADDADGEVTFTSLDKILSGFIGKQEIARGAMKRVHPLTLSGQTIYVAKSFFRVEEMGLDDSVSASENQVELKLELRRIAQGQWFLKKFYEHARLIVVDSIYQGLRFVDAYLGTEVEPTGITGHEDDSEILTPWTWIVEPRRPMSVTKWSGTLTHPNHHGDLIGATICAFVHFAYVYSHDSIVFADIQGTYAQITHGVEGLVLFDVMTHTAAGDSGIGDHGVAGIQSFLDDHICGPICKKMRLKRLAAIDEDVHSPGSGEEEQESEPERGCD